MGPEFLAHCKNGVLNYVLLRPCTALIAFVSESQDMYGEGELGNPLKAGLLNRSRAFYNRSRVFLTGAGF